MPGPHRPALLPARRRPRQAARGPDRRRPAAADGRARCSRLTAPLTVPDLKEYGRARRSTTLEAGTYWISMAQPQKHWVQAMLNEDTYVPFPYFYDVTAWSLPLLANVRGGWSGERLSPTATPLPPLPSPSPHARSLTGAPRLPADLPRVGVLQLSQDDDLGDRVVRMAAVAARAGLEDAVRQRHGVRHRRRRAGRGRRAARAQRPRRRRGSPRSARPARRAVRLGRTTAAATSAGAAAPSSRPRSGSRPPR